ncbi:MAG: hypothetical protein MZV49_09600 [Rhodopseudomonas palustris]|nr:hypothetical protein [Rhodopseudomonas palustris]
MPIRQPGHRVVALEPLGRRLDRAAAVHLGHQALVGPRQLARQIGDQALQVRDALVRIGGIGCSARRGRWRRRTAEAKWQSRQGAARQGVDAIRLVMRIAADTANTSTAPRHFGQCVQTHVPRPLASRPRSCAAAADIPIVAACGARTCDLDLRLGLAARARACRPTYCCDTTMTILFLDFDGVLHPDPCRDRARLFEHAPRLAAALAPFTATGRGAVDRLAHASPGGRTGGAPAARAARQGGGRDAAASMRSSGGPPWCRTGARPSASTGSTASDRAPTWLALDDRAAEFEPYCDRLIVTRSATGLDEAALNRLRFALTQAAQRQVAGVGRARLTPASRGCRAVQAATRAAVGRSQADAPAARRVARQPLPRCAPARLGAGPRPTRVKITNMSEVLWSATSRCTALACSGRASARRSSAMFAPFATESTPAADANRVSADALRAAVGRLRPGGRR